MIPLKYSMMRKWLSLLIKGRKKYGFFSLGKNLSEDLWERILIFQFGLIFIVPIYFLLAIFLSNFYSGFLSFFSTVLIIYLAKRLNFELKDNFSVLPLFIVLDTFSIFLAIYFNYSLIPR